jgi:group I intron endonuclease
MHAKYTHLLPMIYVKTGIYLIRCTVNGKVYVGQSTQIRIRWATHIKALTQGKGSPAFVKDWQAYGPKCFEWTVLEETGEWDLAVAEKKWIEHYRAADPRYGYNRTKYLSSMHWRYMGKG